MNRQEKSGVSSVGRAASPEDAIVTMPVQCGSVVQNGSEACDEIEQVSDTDHVTEREKVIAGDVEGDGETLRVGGSSPSHLTNLLATWTPHWLAADMVALARIYTGMRVLEPSAGRGSIVNQIHRLSACRVTAIELNGDFIADLRDTNAVVMKQDFLRLSMPEYFDRVIMNPPKNAIPHIVKAAECLVKGGRLVALVHRETARALSFTLGDHRVYSLPEETFILPDGSRQLADLIVWDRP